MSPRIAILAISALSLGVSSGMAADADNGQRLAQRWCASCHVVEPNQREASADAPPFASIAKAPGFNAQRVAFFLLEPHPKMPPMSLTRRDAEDLAAYMARLTP